MQRILIVVLALLSIAAAKPPIKIKIAEIGGGKVLVQGKVRGVEKGTPVMWEGKRSAVVDKRGRFTIVSELRPDDCIGKLQIGEHREFVPLKYCR